LAPEVAMATRARMRTEISREGTGTMRWAAPEQRMVERAAAVAATTKVAAVAAATEEGRDVAAAANRKPAILGHQVATFSSSTSQTIGQTMIFLRLSRLTVPS